MAIWVESKDTPLTFSEARAMLYAALFAEIGKPVTNDVLSIALSKTALETGRWQKMKLGNWGNIKVDSSTHQYQTFPCNEVIKNDVVWFSPSGKLSGKGGVVVSEPYDDPPGHPQTRFVAYANPTDGAYEYIAFQARRSRYLAAWQRLLAGDVEGYVRALSAAGYFTAPVESYLATTTKLFREFSAKLAGGNPPEVEVPNRWDWQEDAVRSVGQRFDDIGIIRREALRELSGLDTERDTERPEAPDTEREPRRRS